MKTASLFACVALATTLTAQTQTLRGKVEDVQNTVNQFYLDCTAIPLQSSAVNLNLWIGQEAVLDVVNVGSATAPVLRVDGIQAAVPNFDMGNLRLGQTARWQVNAPAGSFGFVFLDFTSNTGYTPFGGFGTWLLGANAATIASGTTNLAGQFEFLFPMPQVAGLVGTAVSSQALVGDHGTWFFSNPDCKTIQQ